VNRLPICIRTSQDYRTRLFVPALLRAFSRAQDCFRYDWHLAEKFDVAELECLRIDFQLGIRVLRWELKFNIDLRLELCLRTANELICNASSRGIPGPLPHQGGRQESCSLSPGRSRRRAATRRLSIHVVVVEAFHRLELLA